MNQHEELVKELIDIHTRTGGDPITPDGMRDIRDMDDESLIGTINNLKAYERIYQNTD